MSTATKQKPPTEGAAQVIDLEYRRELDKAVVSLQRAILSMVRPESTDQSTDRLFFGFLVDQMQKYFRPDLPAPAGVAVLNHAIRLFINPPLWNKFTLREQVAILEHECKHVVYLHPLRKGNRNHHNYNIAADCAINQHIEKLPDGCVTLKGLRERLKNPDLAAESTMEYYYDKIVDYVDRTGDGDPMPDGQQVLDDHSQWDETHDGEAVQEEMAEQVVRDAVLRAKEKGAKAGQLSDGLEEALKELFKPKVSWQQELQRFAHSILSATKTGTRSRRNRRFGLKFMGRRREFTSHIVMCVDTSGSMSTEMLQQAMGEIRGAYQAGARITVVQCDYDVQSVQEYDDCNSLTVKGRGGTRYQPALDKAEELGADGIIYLGDMGVCGEALRKPAAPVLWVDVYGGGKPADFGRYIRVEFDGGKS